MKNIYRCLFCAGEIKTVEFRSAKNGGKRSLQNIGVKNRQMTTKTDIIGENPCFMAIKTTVELIRAKYRFKSIFYGYIF